MKSWIVLALLAGSSFACKPRAEDASRVKGDEDLSLTDFAGRLRQIDETSRQVGSNLFSVDSNSEVEASGIALADVALEDDIRRAIDLTSSLSDKAALTAADRALLQTLSTALQGLLQSVPDLSAAQRGLASVAVGNAIRRLNQPEPAARRYLISINRDIGCVSDGFGIDCWGTKLATTPPPPLTDVTKLMVGNGVACAIAGGVAQCWGEKLFQYFNGQKVLDIGLPRVPSGPKLPYDMCALLENHELKCLADGYGNFSQSKTVFERIAVNGQMVCAWAKSGVIMCRGPTKSSPPEFATRLLYSGIPDTLVVTTENGRNVICAAGSSGVSCERGDHTRIDMPEATAVSYHEVCVTSGGKVRCTTDTLKNVDTSSLDGALAADVSYDVDRKTALVCGLFPNRKVRCVAERYYSDVLVVPERLKAP